MKVICNKYLAAALLFLFGNEVLSLVTLSVLAIFFVTDILKARAEL